LQRGKTHLSVAPFARRRRALRKADVNYFRVPRFADFALATGMAFSSRPNMALGATVVKFVKFVNSDGTMNTLSAVKKLQDLVPPHRDYDSLSEGSG
jgi:hypothetical protein